VPGSSEPPHRRRAAPVEVVVEPHNPGWADKFQPEKAVRSALKCSTCGPLLVVLWSNAEGAVSHFDRELARRRSSKNPFTPMCAAAILRRPNREKKQVSHGTPQ
jgi:hypothetical protein